MTDDVRLKLLSEVEVFLSVTPPPRPADGVMIQITAETMESLRQALRDMKDFTVTCGKADQEENQEQVHVQWTEDDHNFNRG